MTMMSGAPLVPYHPAREFAGGADGGLWDLRYWRKRLWQDAAKTTRVTAVGDPVGCVENLLGDATWDLIQETSGNRPVLAIEDGLPFVDCANGKGLYTRGFKLPALPTTILFAGSSAGTAANVMGWQVSTKVIAYLLRSSIGQMRFDTSHTSVPAGGGLAVLLTQTQGPSYAVRDGTRNVAIGVLSAGTQSTFTDDMAENQGMSVIYSPKSNGFTTTATMQAAKMFINGSGGNSASGGTAITINANQSVKFFGGLVKYGTLADRVGCARYFMEQMACLN